MPKYRCHKEVWALKIEKVESIGETTLMLYFSGETFAPATLDGDAFMKFKHLIGLEHPDHGYYVQYKDGYQSWSPSDAFEEGYTLITNEHG